MATPQLFRRKDVLHRKWVAFAFDYKDKRYTGFVAYNALTDLDRISPTEAFDRDKQRILTSAAGKVDASQFDPEGRVLIAGDDMQPEVRLRRD